MVRWIVGMTTAPRPGGQVFVNDTVQQFVDCGWTHIDVFAEPGSGVAMRPEVTITQRPVRLGLYANWRQSLREMAGRTADMYAIVQDDIVLSEGIKQALELAVDRYGVLSPYTSRKDHRPGEDGWFESHSGWNLCGAQFFCMNAEVMKRIAKMPASADNNRNVDARLGIFCQTAEIPLWLHRPSLVDHVADEHSTVGYTPNAYCRRAHGYVKGPTESGGSAGPGTQVGG